MILKFNETFRSFMFTNGYLGSRGFLLPFFRLEIGELIFLRLYHLLTIFFMSFSTQFRCKDILFRRKTQKQNSKMSAKFTRKTNHLKGLGTRSVGSFQGLSVVIVNMEDERVKAACCVAGGIKCELQRNRPFLVVSDSWKPNNVAEKGGWSRKYFANAATWDEVAKEWEG